MMVIKVFAQGEICGNIILTLHGVNGFGFDPIIKLNNGKTLAELDSEVKNLCSARYLTAKELNFKLSKILEKTRKKI